MGVTNTLLRQILDILTRRKTIDDTVEEHREKIYPYDGLGAIVVCGNTVWGDIVEVIPIDAITTDYGWDAGAVLDYALVGMDIISKASPTIQCTLNFLRVVKATVQTLDVDSGLGEANPDRIYVPATGDYEVGDWVWVFDTDDTGELSQIEAIDTDNYLDMDGNLTKLYEIAKAAKVYLIRRMTAHGEYRSVWTPFSAASTKEMQHIELHDHREMTAGDGLIARGRSTEAGAPEVYVVVTYDDS